LKPTHNLSQYGIVGGWRREDWRNCLRHVGIPSLPHLHFFGILLGHIRHVCMLCRHEPVGVVQKVLHGLLLLTEDSDLISGTLEIRACFPLAANDR